MIICWTLLVTVAGGVAGDYPPEPSVDPGSDPVRIRRFLEGLVIEAGRQVLFPELYHEEVAGQPEVGQSYSNRKRSGDPECTEDCPVYKPVCGTDGKVYQSECHLRRENCGTAVTSGPWGTCRGTHYLCPSRCLEFADPVCASDGRIYRNTCLLRKRNCGKLLQILPINECYDKQLPSSGPCPEECPDVPGPVCGSDGALYFNECFMRLQTCGRGVFRVVLESCVPVPGCPEVCLPVPDPVCGSDGRLYINRCRMRQENCGKDVKTMPDSFCAVDDGLGDNSQEI